MLELNIICSRIAGTITTTRGLDLVRQVIIRDSASPAGPAAGPSLKTPATTACTFGGHPTSCTPRTIPSTACFPMAQNDGTGQWDQLLSEIKDYVYCYEIKASSPAWSRGRACVLDTLGYAVLAVNISSDCVTWMKTPSSDQLLRDLAITGSNHPSIWRASTRYGDRVASRTVSRRGVVFFCSQNDMTLELLKELAESKRLLDWMNEIVLHNHDIQIRHRWQNPNDMAIRDKRCLVHTATPDYLYQGLGDRRDSRVLSVGERPYFDPEGKAKSEALADGGNE